MMSSKDHVSEHSPESNNQKINAQTQENIRQAIGYPEHLDERLRELDQEWNIEWVLECMAGGLILGRLGLSRQNKKWLILSGVVAAFLLEHAVQGWCPPVPLLRNLGLRTQKEIDVERYALKALRGDFENVPRFRSAENSLAASWS